MLCVAWRSEDDTQAFAARLAASAAIRDVFIELRGDLGAGKTTFVRHLLRALGVTGRITSPSFSVVEAYQVAWPQRIDKKMRDGLHASDAPFEQVELAIWHFDFYRFNDPREWEDAGLRDLFAAPGLKLAEWPEQVGALLPTADLVLQIELLADGSTRAVEARAATLAGQQLIA